MSRLCGFYPGICLTTEEKAWKNLRVWTVSRLCGFYPGICLTTEEKTRKNLRVWVVSRLCGFYPGIYLTTVEKARTNLKVWAMSRFMGFTLAFALQLRKKHGKTSVSHGDSFGDGLKLFGFRQKRLSKVFPSEYGT